MSILSRRRSGRGFTLIELIAVMAIIIILTALTLPPAVRLVRSYGLTSASRDFVNQLALGRQTALGKGLAVQVRLYKLPAYNSALTASPTVFRGIECFTEGAATSRAGTISVPLTPITKPLVFNNMVVVLGNSTQSTLLTLPVTVATSTDPTLPGYVSNYQYIAFHFKPSSQTDLLAAANTIALAQQNDPVGATGFPANFILLKINAFNGTVQTYQP